MSLKFEKLEVWRESIELSGLVSDIAGKFPRQELYVLNSQIQRAADLVSLNIAEGSTGQSNAEFKRFLGYSVRSAIEVIGCIYLAKRRKIISQEDFNIIYETTVVLLKRIQSLRKSLI